jgi:hypothetical protein
MGKYDRQSDRKISNNFQGILMNQEQALLKRGQFYFIYDGNDDATIILEDKTKRGLDVRERNMDETYGVEAEKGVIYDMDGTGHSISIRWFFPRANYQLEYVIKIAEEMDAKYKAIREITCPDDE